MSSSYCCLMHDGDAAASAALDVLNVIAADLQAVLGAVLKDKHVLGGIRAEIQATLQQVKLGKNITVDDAVATVAATALDMEMTAEKGISSLRIPAPAASLAKFKSKYVSPLTDISDGLCKDPVAASLAYLCAARDRHHFHDLSNNDLSRSSLLGIDIINSSEKAKAQFQMRQLQLWSQGSSSRERLLLTVLPAGGSKVDMLMEGGCLDLCRCTREANSLPIYVADSPLAFDLKDKVLVLCRVLLGSTQTKGSLSSFLDNQSETAAAPDSLKMALDTVPEPGEDPDQRELLRGKSGEVYALLDPAQVLPFTVLRLDTSGYSQEEQERRREELRRAQHLEQSLGPPPAVEKKRPPFISESEDALKKVLWVLFGIAAVLILLLPVLFWFGLTTITVYETRSPMN